MPISNDHLPLWLVVHRLQATLPFRWQASPVHAAAQVLHIQLLEPYALGSGHNPHLQRAAGDWLCQPVGEGGELVVIDQMALAPNCPQCLALAQRLYPGP